MNQEIGGDVRFFLASVILGWCAALVYDMFRIGRRVRKQSLFAVSVQDFLFWFGFGVAGFGLMYRYNAGVVRFFSLLGMGLGAIVYLCTIGRFFVRYCVKVWLILTYPVRKGLNFLRKQVKLVRDRWRKRLAEERKDALARKKRKKEDGA